MALLDMVWSMMSFVELPKSFWGHAIDTVIYVLNRIYMRVMYIVWVLNTLEIESRSSGSLLGCALEIISFCIVFSL